MVDLEEISLQRTSSLILLRMLGDETGDGGGGDTESEEIAVNG